VLEAVILATYQERLNGLIAIGVDARIARVIAFRPELVGELGLAAQVALNPSIEVLPRIAASQGLDAPMKRRRRTTKYQKALSKAMVNQNGSQRKKNGQYKKGKSAKTVLQAAHREARRSLK